MFETLHFQNTTIKSMRQINPVKLKILIIFILILISSTSIYCQTNKTFAQKLSEEAVELTKVRVVYDPTYRTIDYPNGDVPSNTGVCTDVLIRAYRKLGIDLQKDVHEDMSKNFRLYPKNWGLIKPDRNIDHRRVPNLMVFFSRFGETLAISQNSSDFTTGDIVAWDLGGGLTHIGIVIDQKSSDGKRNLIVHNIGNGQEISDCLFSYTIIGHYKYPK